MSNSRLNSSLSRSKSKNKSFLHQPIQYRKIVHLRNDHHQIVQSSSRSKNRPQPSESHLQLLINIDPRGQKYRSQNSSISYSRSNEQQNITSSNLLKTPKNPSLSRNVAKGEPSKLHQTAKLLVVKQESPNQQKLAIKQQKAVVREPVEVRIEEEIERINEKLNRVVNKKLKITFESLKCKKKGQFEERKREVNRELQGLIGEIRMLQNRSHDIGVLNQKIALIETMMAEQCAEAELMKKYYYNLSSNRIKGKAGDFTHLKTRVGDVFKSISHYENKNKRIKTVPYEKESFQKKPLFKETTNKSSYKSPDRSDYESYRYRSQASPMNLQPLPRSSYRRDFLILKPHPNEKIVNRDHSPYYPTSKLRVGSIYGQDYKSTKTETIDHRELDAFRNKIKTLKISYMPESKIEGSDNRQYYKDVEQSRSRIRSNNSGMKNVSEQELSYNKKNLLSESRREYLGEKTFEPSKIKHQQLQQFQYKFKNLFKA